MSLIKKKELRLGKLFFVWDWFEFSKWLSFFNGVMFCFGLTFIFLREFSVIDSDWRSLFLIVLAFILIGVNGAIINLVRKDVIVNKEV